MRRQVRWPGVALALAALSALGGCREQRGVAVHQFVEQVNKLLGEEDARMSRLEHDYADLRASWEKQVFAKHELAVLADTSRIHSRAAAEDVGTLEAKLASIRKARASGTMYAAKSGREYGARDLEALDLQVSALIARGRARTRNATDTAARYAQYAAVAAELEQRVRDSLETVRADLDELKARRAELQVLRDEVELAKELSSNVGSRLADIRSGIERTSVDTEAGLRASRELLSVYLDKPAAEQLQRRLTDF